MSEADNSTFEWTQDLTINLAELLESESVLWDKSHPDYKKGGVKHDALKRMADIFGTTALVVQCKLNNIRSQFLREEKKVLKKRSGCASSTNYASKWFLYDYLKFLNGCVETKNVSRSKESSAAIVTEEEIVTINDEEDEDRIFHGEHEDESMIHPANRESVCKNDQRQKIENQELRKAVAALSNSILEQSSHSKEREKEEDDCDIFGRLVAKRMRMIQNPIIRLVAEQEISSCIARKICEDSGIEMTTVCASTEWPPSILSTVKTKYEGNASPN